MNRLRLGTPLRLQACGNGQLAGTAQHLIDLSGVQLFGVNELARVLLEGDGAVLNEILQSRVERQR